MTGLGQDLSLEYAAVTIKKREDSLQEALAKAAFNITCMSAYRLLTEEELSLLREYVAKNGG